VAVFPFWALLLRVWVGGVLLVYALRSSFGFFPNTGVPVQTISGTAVYMNKFGWRPGLFWAWLSTINNVVGGAMLALGFLTRPVALTSTILLFLSAVTTSKTAFFQIKTASSIMRCGAAAPCSLSFTAAARIPSIIFST
jgi:putative oxidoreductase